MSNRIFILLLFILAGIIFSTPIMQDPYTPESGRFWVFFADKGSNPERFKEEIVTNLSEHNKSRRLRVRKEEDLVTFADLPIEKSYVQQIEQLGFEIHRQSKWLNAVSIFAENFGQIKSLIELDFVNSLKPVVTYRRPIEEFGDDIDAQSPKPDGDAPNSSKEAHFELDYGYSIDQLQMIGMVEVHRMGFNGDGVILGVFDTGFRTSHQAMAHLDIIAEWDFVDDDSSTSTPETAQNHGTATWSAAAGSFPGELYGPGFGADIILARTEDSFGEYEGEEDNWVAAMEWAESLDVDVVSSSLGYNDWYTAEDMNGDSCITTRGADVAASLGVLVVNAAGNSGFGVTTIVAPADADSIIAVGAVSHDSTLSGFSSRGPTADGRIKPNLCALGFSTRCARAASDFDFGSGSGTSLATPLIGGACAALLQAYPDWGPMQVLAELEETAHNKLLPDNDYGWGIPNFSAAMRVSGDSLAMFPFFRGWNMISNPFSDTLALDPSVFPEMFSYCWSYDPVTKDYYAVDELAPGQACFFPYYSDTIIFIAGEVSDSLFTPLSPGWNMIGASGKTAIPGEYHVVPETAVFDGVLYDYDTDSGEYIQKQTLFPGEARWILITEHSSFFVR